MKIHNGNRSGKRLLAFSLFGVEQIASETSRSRQVLIHLNRIFTEDGWDGQEIMIGDNQVGWTLAVDSDSGALYDYSRGDYAIPFLSSFLEQLVGFRDSL